MAGPADWFTGQVWVEGVLGLGAVTQGSRLAAAQVTFSPGARTAWHTHPVGQTLLVTSGVGWVQKEGEPATQITAGDVVLIAAGENHWHGAHAGHSMVHIAMQEADASGEVVVWGRQVTDAEYGNASGSAHL